MEDLQLKFNQYLRGKFDDLEELYASKFVLAVSGGVDSMVMLDLFKKEFDPDNLVVAHLDHMIREDSKGDLEVIKRYCIQNQIKFVNESIDVKKFPGNIEANARQIRYNFLEKVRRDYSCNWIVTAHHIDDQAETIFMSTMKGAFVSGMSGIDFMDLDRKLIRPMLFASKSDLQNYSKVRGISFVLDSTNDDLSYDRNFLRKDIFPRLDERFSGFAERISEMGYFYRELEEYLLERVDKWAEGYCVLKDYGWEIEVKDFKSLPGFMRFMVLQKLTMQRKDLKMSRANFADIDDMIERSQSGKMKKVGDFNVYIFEKKLLISRMDLEELSEWYWNKCIQEFKSEVDNIKDSLVSFEDGMKVMVEYGPKHGSKEVPLKDFLKQQNVAWFFRKGVPVLLNESGLVEKCWVL